MAVAQSNGSFICGNFGVTFVATLQQKFEIFLTVGALADFSAKASSNTRHPC
jgi:hypothetical protein